jgi:shikimate kinase
MKNIILIGMPGAGKSTVGVLLAKRLAMQFIDTDLLIQNQTGKPLQTIVDEQGYLHLRAIEEEVIRKLNISNAVIATGGSAVYSESAMKHLRSNGTVIYLLLPEEQLLERLTNYTTRGIAKAPKQSFHDLFGERTTLYRKYGEIVIDCRGKNQDGIVSEIILNKVHSGA